MEIMKAMAAIACSHKQLVKTDENTVCSNCGMVVNELDYSTEGMHDSGRSKMNLFETKAIGTRNDLPKTKENMQFTQVFPRNGKGRKGKARCRDTLKIFKHVRQAGPEQGGIGLCVGAL